MRTGLTMGTLVAIPAVTTTGCTTQRYWGGSTAAGNNTQARIGPVASTP
jgi:fructose transport system substrate-binding protein